MLHDNLRTHSTMTDIPGLRTFTAYQWRLLMALAGAHTDGEDPERLVGSLLGESERVGVFPEAQLVLGQISGRDYESQVSRS